MPGAGSATIAGLISRLPGLVVLNTPRHQSAFALQPVSATDYCKWLIGDYAFIQRNILLRAPVVDLRLASGHFPMDADGEMLSLPEGWAVLTETPVPEGLHTEGFILGIRQTTLFTALLPQIAALTDLQILAVIRHPLVVCSDWLSQPAPLMVAGKPAGIARFWPEALEHAQHSTPESVVQLYEGYLQRYHEHSARTHIIRYEDVIAQPTHIGQLFGRPLPDSAAQHLSPQLPRQAHAQETELRRALLRYGVYSKLYYKDITGYMPE